MVKWETIDKPMVLLNGWTTWIIKEQASKNISSKATFTKMEVTFSFNNRKPMWSVDTEVVILWPVDTELTVQRQTIKSNFA